MMLQYAPTVPTIPTVLPINSTVAGLVFLALSLRCYFLCLPCFRLTLSCRRPVGPSTGHAIGLIVTANSNVVPSGLGLCPERMHDDFDFNLIYFGSFLFSFSFPFCCSAFHPSFGLLFRVCVSIHDGYVPGIIWLQVIRDGVKPQLVLFK